MLTADEIQHYNETERAISENEARYWVRGSAFERDRLCLVLERCLEKFCGDVLEIGCLTGGTTRRLAPIAQKYDRTIVCVDPWTPGDYHGNDMESTYQEFVKLITPFGAEIIRGSSQDEVVIRKIQNRRYAFVFVDGDHSQGACLRDLLTVMPITDGIIVVDDILNLPEVEPALEQALKECPQWMVELQTPYLIEAYLRKQ